MEGDTNFIGLRILFPLCLIFYLDDHTHEKRWKKYVLIFCIFIFLTLSRSAIITVIILLFIRHFISLLKHRHYLVLSGEIVIVLLVLILLFQYIYIRFMKTDYSFTTKLSIFSSMSKIKGIDSENVLFGFGITKGRYFYSYREGTFAHTHYALIIGQFGVIGLFLYIIYFTGMCYLTRGAFFYLFAAFAISGFSLTDLGPNLFWVSGLLAVISRRKNMVNVHCT
jgi:hypothetical protein